MKIQIKLGMRLVGENMIPLIIDLMKYCHWIICGPSGSGKSYLLKYIFASLLKYQDVLEIYCMDFKNSGDYDFMDRDHLSVGKECVQMIEEVYGRYTMIKENNLPNIVLSVFDEYASFIKWLAGYDKGLCKTITDHCSEILMTGRRLNKNGGGCYMFTVLQRPDAEYFGSSRENYFVKIVMRDVTRSIRTMLEIDEEDIPEEHIAKPGRGICTIDNDVYAFIVPTYDERLMEAMLKAKRSEAESIAEVPG